MKSPLETLGRKMLGNDPALKAAFEQKLRDEKVFSASPSERLNFFFKRSPW